MKRAPRHSGASGFSLLEVLIAFSIITVVAASVYIMQANSLFSSLRTKNMLIAANLARSFLAKSELELEAKEFTTIDKEEDGQFAEPYETFKWKREVKEQDFSALSKIVADASGALAGGEEEGAKPDAEDQNKDAQQLVIKVFENFLKDSLRTLKVTIIWTEDGKEKTLSVTTLLVRYDAQFRATM